MKSLEELLAGIGGARNRNNNFINIFKFKYAQKNFWSNEAKNLRVGPFVWKWTLFEMKKSYKEGVIQE